MLNPGDKKWYLTFAFMVVVFVSRGEAYATQYPLEGTLTVVKGSGPQVYLIENGKKRAIPDPATFKAMGFSWDAIRQVPDEVLQKFPDGLPLASVKSQKPSVASPGHPAEPRQTKELSQKIRLYNEKISSISKSLLKAVPNPPSFTPRLVSNEEVNAWADGTITTGMMEFLYDKPVGSPDDQLALVLAHEIAHAKMNHVEIYIMLHESLKQESRTLQERINLIEFVFTSLSLEPIHQTPLTHIVSTVAPQIAKVVGDGLLKYLYNDFTRDQEAAADFFGLLFAHRAGFNIREGTMFFGRKKENRIDTFFRDHFASHFSYRTRYQALVKEVERIAKLATEEQRAKQPNYVPPPVTLPAPAPQPPQPAPVQPPQPPAPVTTPVISQPPATTLTPVILTLYVRDGSASGPVIPGARVTGQDARGNRFDGTANSAGYVNITGAPGAWSFTVSRDGYTPNSWSQGIMETTTKHAFIHRIITQPQPQPAQGLRVGVNAVVRNTHEPGQGYIGLKVRDAPGVNSNKIGNLPEGTRLRIIGGPISKDGYVWWNVESSLGKGWCAGNWIAPVP